VYKRYAIELPHPSPYNITATGSEVFTVIQTVEGVERRFVIGPENGEVTLTATGSPPLLPVLGWMGKSGPSGWDPRYNFSPTVTMQFRWGISHAAPLTGANPIENKITVSVGSTEGGRVLGSHANQWSGIII
jgi:hypothetical protein